MTIEPAQHSVNGWNSEYIEAMYERWLDNPESIDIQWQQFFSGFELGLEQTPGTPGPPVDSESQSSVEFADQPVQLKLERGLPAVDASLSADFIHTRQGLVDDLIYEYRDRGHRGADLDPLHGDQNQPHHPQLASHNLSESDLDLLFDPGDLPLDTPCALKEIVKLLDETYCRHIGVEFMHIQDPEQRHWLQQQMESVRNRPTIDSNHKMRILGELSQADAFETFLHTRFTAKKRFGLDGSESLIPLMQEMIEQGADNGVKEFTFGMAHRGRLNVLVNVLQKTYDQIFTEFAEAWTEDFVHGGGDVKYHRGYSSDRKTSSGENIRLTLSPNPSHLEFVGPVVLGRARAKQRIRHDSQRNQCIPVLLHGDASFPGQGIVAECLNMVNLDGYKVGGTIHIIINNQIGFTTNPVDAKSGTYCTDIAKMTEAPIFHVNGDDPEACAFVAKLALEYRQTFKNDAVIDMWCYREFGHNEGDEPTFTQPLMYARIKTHPAVLQTYAKQLISEGVISDSAFNELYETLKSNLDAAQTRSTQTPVPTSVDAFSSVWAGLKEKYSSKEITTGVSRERLAVVAQGIGSIPNGFTPHRKLKKQLEYRSNVISKDDKIDWAMGELLAYGSLLLEGHAVRLTGQDVERGTFSHRHCVIIDQATGEAHDSLNSLSDNQARFCVHNSPLTESACVAFEYGYSLGDPEMLVIWEAQFGDFANGAQVIFDQFLASAEAKWNRYSGITLFLPHGYEGQGPEHSSARPERFLQLCANNNMQIVNPTTPAQMFHLLRRQIKRSFRKPLVVLTPKSLLRHTKVVSCVDDFVNGQFDLVLDDPMATDAKKITRLLLCSGKIYYDLIAHRETVKRDDVAIVRIEQQYPLPKRELSEILERYTDVRETVWVQEEPKNMGAYRFFKTTLLEEIDLDLSYVGRDESASPAVASAKMHAQEQEKIMINAVGLPTSNGTTESNNDEQPQARLSTS